MLGFCAHKPPNARQCHSFLDKETRSGDRSVISLWRLLDDVEKNIALLTRENLLACLDLPYDYERVKEDVLKRYTFTNGPRLMGDDYKQCVLAENVHEYMDALADVDSSQRSPSDTVRETIIQWLKVKLEGCRAVYGYVNKFLAHSATPESRAQLPDDETKITLGQILHAHEVICQIAAFIGQNLFLRSIGNPLPIPQFDQFQHFEKPWVTVEALQKLYEWWRGYEESTNQWLKWDWETEYAAHDVGSNG